MERPKIIAIVGANASGKSSLGLELAKCFNGEIISADSRQVYRGFDLCCGKVTAEEARIVPHHMLNIKDIGEPFSVYDFQKMAYSLIPQIIRRGKLPFIVGGTGLYVRAVVEGFPLGEEPPDNELRGKLGALPIEELQAMLTPEAREFMATKPSDLYNKRRLIAVLEKVTRGLPLGRANSARYDALQLGTRWPKEMLHRRIEERLDARIEQGMIDEVKSYLDSGGCEEHLYSLGLEYRCILEYLTGKFRTLDEFRLIMAQEIKRFAKRQATWFKRDSSIKWIDMDADYIGQARTLISEFLAPDVDSYP